MDNIEPYYWNFYQYINKFNMFTRDESMFVVYRKKPKEIPTNVNRDLINPKMCRHTSDWKLSQRSTWRILIGDMAKQWTKHHWPKLPKTPSESTWGPASLFPTRSYMRSTDAAQSDWCREMCYSPKLVENLTKTLGFCFFLLVWK